MNLHNIKKILENQEEFFFETQFLFLQLQELEKKYLENIAQIKKISFSEIIRFSRFYAKNREIVYLTKYPYITDYDIWDTFIDSFKIRFDYYLTKGDDKKIIIAPGINHINKSCVIVSSHSKIKEPTIFIISNDSIQKEGFFDTFILKILKSLPL